MNWKIALDYRFAQDTFDCYIYREAGDTREYQQPGGVWKQIPYDATYPLELVPSFSLMRHVARELMDALAHEGVTPRQQTLIEGKYEAQTAHLHDLQNILKKQGYMA